jgi:hypothetical protein
MKILPAILELLGDMNKNKYILRIMCFEHKRLSQGYTPFRKNKPVEFVLSLPLLSEVYTSIDSLNPS